MAEENNKAGSAKVESNKTSSSKVESNKTSSSKVESNPEIKATIASEPRRRQIAYKLRIGDLSKGKPMNDGERFGFLELGSKRIVRVNIVANIVEKYDSEDGRFSSITLDDATGQLRARVFGEDIKKFKILELGNTIIIIGTLRQFNQEVYVNPEIVKISEPSYLLVRKLELEKERSLIPITKEKHELVAVQDQIIDMIKKAEIDGGIDKERLIMEISASPDLINEEIQKLLEEGIVYEPRPGRVRFLG
jgi:RecG-like helicase